MAEASGISEAGPGVLLSGVGTDAVYLSMEANATYAGRPRRVGYWYVLRQTNGTPSEGTVIDSGPMYSPGVYKTIPVLGHSGGDTFTLRMDWNVSGLEWYAYLGP